MKAAKKILSFVVEGNKILVTGDSNRNPELPVGHKQFAIGEPYWIDFVTPEGRTEFFQNLLQDNHDYTLSPDEIVIDGISYDIKGYVLESYVTKNKHIFPSRTARNLFNEYKEFVSFHVGELMLKNLENAVEELLKLYDIEKGVSEIIKSVDGFEIQVVEYSYNEQKYLNFALHISPDRKVKFLHFFEPEGEYYTSGDVPLTRIDIEAEIAMHQRRLEKFDYLKKLFDITL